MTTTQVPVLPCPRCGAIDRPVVQPGNGPYALRSKYIKCSAFLKWLSKYTPEERQARQVRFIQHWKESRHGV
jgi:hypothetical protein